MCARHQELRMHRDFGWNSVQELAMVHVLEPRMLQWVVVSQHSASFWHFLQKLKMNWQMAGVQVSPLSCLCQEHQIHCQLVSAQYRVFPISTFSWKPHMYQQAISTQCRVCPVAFSAGSSTCICKWAEFSTGSPQQIFLKAVTNVLVDEQSLIHISHWHWK